MAFRISLPLGTEESLATLSKPRPSIYELELHAGPHNTLSAHVINECILRGLDIVEEDWRSSTTTGPTKGKAAAAAFILSGTKGRKSKYFSRGLVPGEARSEGFTHNVLHPLISRLLAFPLPTVAVVNGHAYAGGFFAMLACDYRIMESNGAVALMTELKGGFPITPALGALLHAKFPSNTDVRKTILDSHAWTAAELEKLGVVDVVVPRQSVAKDWDKIFEVAYDLAQKIAPIASQGAWGLLRKTLYSGVMEVSGKDFRVVFPGMESVSSAREIRMSRL